VASDETKARLRRELKRGADGGAGLVELLDHLQASNSRLGRWERLSEEERDELSLFCWSLSTTDQPRPIADRASTIWGSLGASGPGKKRFRRRARPAG
jgi:hypothetical protein